MAQASIRSIGNLRQWPLHPVSLYGFDKYGLTASTNFTIYILYKIYLFNIRDKVGDINTILRNENAAVYVK